MCILGPGSGWDIWDYDDNLAIIFSRGRLCCSLGTYLPLFFSYIDCAPSITRTLITSILYCRIRGPTSYPFLLVRLVHAHDHNRPILLKLQGFDGPQGVTDPEALWPTYASIEEGTSFSLAGVGETERELVGTRHYDVYHTMVFPAPDPAPTIVDLLAVTELATQHDHTRAGHPPTLFLALKDLFNGVVTSSTKRRAKAVPLSSLDIVQDTKNTVVDEFPAGRGRMQEEIDRCVRAD
ncbi:hypothetical protein FB451DRAFT_673162 [Mycena latifolia]|nr:hypothetical protein FB451DRAFT_673162 [Mycena latifolia]